MPKHLYDCKHGGCEEKAGTNDGCSRQGQSLPFLCVCAGRRGSDVMARAKVGVSAGLGISAALSTAKVHQRVLVWY
jgi:hypothetical protein